MVLHHSSYHADLRNIYDSFFVQQLAAVVCEKWTTVYVFWYILSLVFFYKSKIINTFIAGHKARKN